MNKRRIPEIAISLLLAVILWYQVVSNDSVKYSWTVTDVPLVCTNEQEMRTKHDLMISDQAVDSVSVTYSGSRKDIQALRKHRKDIKAVVDTTSFNAEKEYFPAYQIKPPLALQDRPLIIKSRSPQTVRFAVEKIAKKTVPVEGVFNGTLANGFTAEKPVVSKDSVTIVGPASVVEHIQHVLAILSGDKITETFSQVVELVPVDENGEKIKKERLNRLTLDEKEVDATITVLTEKEVPLKVSVITGGGATEENSTVTLSVQTVTLRGEKKTLDEITELPVGEIRLGNMTQNGELTFAVTPPEGTEFVQPLEEVTAAVSFTGLSTREAAVSEFVTEHVNENADVGLKARVLTKSLDVVLRGPAGKLENLNEEELIAVADLTDYTTRGRFTVPVTIRTTDQTVGALGEYSIEVDLYVEG